MSLVQAINKTETSGGSMTLSRHLAHRSSIETIREQQRLIQLLTPQEHLDELTGLLKECALHEGPFLMFWLRTEPGGTFADYLSYFLEEKSKWMPEGLKSSANLCAASELGSLAWQAATPVLQSANVMQAGCTLYFNPNPAQKFLAAGQGLLAAYELSQTMNTYEDWK